MFRAHAQFRRSTASPLHRISGLCCWLMVAAALLTAALGFQVSAQQPEPGPGTIASPGTKKDFPKNTQGMPLVDVPGIPVAVAAWETRVSDFQAFVEDTKYDWSERPFFSQTPDDPVVNVNLRDAMAFCNWLTKREQASGAITPLQSYRLPTKKEWDAAVGLIAAREKVITPQEREADQQAFPWGREWPPPVKAGNFNSMEISGVEDGFNYTAPVGSFGVTAEGVYDLAGNVWEWTWEQSDSLETGLQAFGVLRGGSWMYFRKECLLSGYQYKVPGETRAPSIGFRYVMEDKRKTAAFLAQQEQDDSEAARKRREELMAGGTKATPEQIEAFRKQMEKTTPVDVSAQGRAPLPDPSTLKPAQPGQAFMNALGMAFQPLSEGGKVLIGVHEVRVQDYQAGATDMGKPWTALPSYEIADVHPVVNVSWNEAVAFCEWLTKRDLAAKLIPEGARYRLPTDVEWSQAAGLKDEKGDTPDARNMGNKADYPWGREPLPPLLSANLDTARMTGYQDNYPHTSPVGSFSPNSLRLHDLAGNVSEWCQDAWPGADAERVVRGSSWLSFAQDSLLSSARQHFPATAVKADVGFRVVLELPAP